MTRFFTLTAACALSAFASAATAGTWTIDSEASVLGFGSIKSDMIGEAHTISGVSGTVAEDGTASIALDLTTMNTNIDIRNERIGEHVFKGAATANLTAQIDMEAVSDLAVGEHMVMEVDGDLSLLGQETPVYVEMFIMRTGEGQVLATSQSMMFVGTDEIGIDAGIDVLQELASLDSITRAFPVTMRFLFNADA